MISVRLDAKLVDALDQLVDEFGLNRTLAIEGLIEQAVWQRELRANPARSMKYKKFGDGPGT